MQHTPTVWNPSSLHFIQHHANINTYGGGNCDAWVVVHLSAHQSRPIHFLRLIAARKFASKTFSGSSTEKTIREKKNGGKRGVLRCAVYKRNFHVFTPGSSSFFFQISGWSSKKEAKILVCLFCSVEEKKKEPREKFCWFDVIVNQATTSR